MSQKPPKLWCDLESVPVYSENAKEIRDRIIHCAGVEPVEQCFAWITGHNGSDWSPWEVEFVSWWVARHHGPVMEAFARLALCRYGWWPVRADVEDIVQEVTGIALHAVIKNYQKGGNFLAYLHKTLFRYARKWMQDRTRLLFPGDEVLDSLASGNAEDPDTRILVEELLDLMAGASPALRKVCEMLREGRTLEEIGADLGVAPGTLRQSLFRARHALQRRLGVGGKQ